MRFTHPEWGVVALALLVLTCMYSRRRVSMFGHSQLSMHMKSRVPIAGRISSITFILAWVMLAMALCQPELVTQAEKRPVLARNIVLTVDNSGSMDDPIVVPLSDGANTPGTQQPRPQSISDAARAGVRYFIEHRPDDRIALLTFDDQIYYDWPLTSDHQYLLGMLDVIKPNSSGGTNFSGPTGILKVGAIEGSIIHLRETETLAGKIVIIVTDGEDSIASERRIELENELVREHISIYVLGVGWDASKSHDLATLVENVGGKVIMVDDAEAMIEAFAEIDKIEQGMTFVDGGELHQDFYLIFVGAALVCLALYLIIATVMHEDT
ncbi:MAG: VWA domain-containing protein [Cyanobacteria bacterium SZAS-4]|nr:VWA domain-containing protein [Cyanobacteria bacterium SZAS-4]